MFMAYVRVALVTFGKIPTYTHTYTYMHTLTQHACARALTHAHMYHTHTAYIYTTLAFIESLGKYSELFSAI